MKLPENLISDVSYGRVVLVLGAGASFGSSTPDGQGPLSGLQLRDLLSHRFLAGGYQQDPLEWVAELAISATNLGTVQDFIAEQFRDLEPADFHLLLPTFRWRGIATTNYDRLIERTYEKVKRPLQRLVVFLSDQDRVDDKLRAPDSLGLLKLHGCITRTHDESLPLILTADQSITHRDGRERLFRSLLEWSIENTVVFVGHSLQDHDLRAVLSEVSRELNMRPRYYFVKPNASSYEVDLWAQKRITVLDGTFEEFIKALDDSISIPARQLAQFLDTDHPITMKYVTSEPFGGAIKDLLQHDAEYVHAVMEYEAGSPQQFYKGFDLGWYPIRERLDVRRRLTDTLLYNVIARPEEDRPTKSELYVIKAEAGAGKTTFLRRVAWEAATQSNALCLIVRPSRTPTFAALQELGRVTKERTFLFIDSAADNTTLISNLLQDSRRAKLALTIITAERVNEWNVSCEEISGYVTEEYRLPYLSRPEIEQLVRLLQDNNALGPFLGPKSLDEQVKEFEKRAGRQLLVALHEATMGRPFEEILVDEFNNIHPSEAQRIYVTVCLLNRLNVPVRAGLVARVHGIGFSQFRDRFLAPLEHVVHANPDTFTGDYTYSARHPQIAQIVFERILTQSTDRYNEYVRVLRKMNISYSSDRQSFRKLVQAKSIQEAFPRHEDVEALYRVAEETAGSEAYLYQQMANYERIRPNGNHKRAYELLQRARELAPKDDSIIHTLAEVIRDQALHSDLPLERHRLRTEARSLLRSLLKTSSDQYARHTLVKLAIDDLQDVLTKDEATDEDLDAGVREVERILETARQKYPSDYFLDTSEAKFSGLLADYERSLKALQSAFEINSRDPYIATRLASQYEQRSDLEAAKGCLEKALENNPRSLELNYRYAQILRKRGEADSSSLAYYFRKAFSKWDSNYEAQFWYARYAFESEGKDKLAEAKDIFRSLRNVPMAHEASVKIRDRIQGENGVKRFVGTISRMELAYGFIVTDGRGDNIFLHRDNVEDSTWDSLVQGGRVSFEIGFTFGGPKALQVRLT